MISFLNPWLWLGAIALGAPIWLHLRRKDREKIVRFSALRFLEDQPLAKRSPIQLRNLLLFLLRALAVLLLVAAFARPFFPKAAEQISSSEVYILDNTLSRQAEQGLEHDREYVLKQIRQAGPREQIAVVEMAIQPRVVVSFGDSPSQAETKLNALQPTNERGSMLAALRQADFLLKQSLGENKHIIVLSDHQENQWTENANVPPFLAPGMVTLSPFSGVSSRPNFYVSEPKVLRIFLGNSAVMQFMARIGHTGEVNSAVVKLTVNGRDILQRPIDLDPKMESANVAAQWEADPSAWVQGSMSVTAQPDDLPQDNTAYFTFPPIAEGRVALLTESIYLKTALSESVAKGHWSAQILQPAALDDVLKAPPNQDADVLMVDANYLQSSQARDLVNRYLESGRGVFIMVGRISTLLTGYLQDLGFAPRSLLASTAPGTMEPIRYFSPESPIFQPFLIHDFSNILEVRVGEIVHLEALRAKPLLFSQEGDGLLFESNKGKGKLLLSTFAFEREQTDWVVHPSFVPFLDSALQYLRPQPVLNNTLEPGEVWLVQIPADQEAKVVVLRSGGQEVARAEVNADHRATLHAPGQPGIYGVTYDDGTAVQQMLAVNPSDKESDLRYLQTDPDMLKAWTLDTKAAPAEQSSAPMLPVAIAAAQQNIWWLALLAGFAALFLEMVVVVKRGQST